MGQGYRHRQHADQTSPPCLENPPPVGFQSIILRQGPPTDDIDIDIDMESN